MFFAGPDIRKQPSSIAVGSGSAIGALLLLLLTGSCDHVWAQTAKKPGKQKAAVTFQWPARGHVIQGFGPKPSGQQNDGINIALPEGTPIKAVGAGVVAYAGNELKAYGNLILVRHDNGFVSAYAHLSELLVRRDEVVKKGQLIAKAGQTGSVSSSQLHFEIRKGSTPVDPMLFLDRSGDENSSQAVSNSGAPDDPVPALLKNQTKLVAVQRVLNEYGYGPLKPTNELDEDTRKAIEKFEKEKKMPVTGRLTDRLLKELSVMTRRPID